MYAAYFGLRDQPFSITPDPAYLYMSPHHQEALAHLLYGTGEQGGFVQLTGEVGTGKTTLIRTLAEQRIEQVDVALCLNPRLTVNEFVAAICDELGVDYPRDSRTLKPLIDALNIHLLANHAQGRRTVVIIDEAQHLSRDVLEQIRLLTNLETHRHKLLRIILVGQPELQRVLARPDMRQLAQRITARYHLQPLDRRNTRAYLQHRLRIAGAREGLFSAAAIAAIHSYSEGIPRLINVIGDRALLAAYADSREQVDYVTLRRAAREALNGGIAQRRTLSRTLMGALVGAAATAIVLAVVPQVSIMPLAGEVAVDDSTPGSQDQVLMATPPLEPNPPPTTMTPPQTPPPPLTATQTAPTIPAPMEAVHALPPPEPMATTPLPAPVTVAPPLPTATTTADFDSLLAAPDNLDAIDQLVLVWGEQVSLQADRDPCRQLEAYQLFCLQGQADLAELHRFNRPAAVTLQNSRGEQRRVVLRSLDDNVAMVTVAGRQWPLSLEQFQNAWIGDYLLLWRLQTDRDFIGPGSWGEAVVWLRQRLALAEGQALTSPLSESFDLALAEQVKRFQRRHQLQPDGLVGARTMTLLNNLAPAPGTPLLTQGRG